MENKETYLFGPVPSRRLGLSLGVDVVPFKFCTLDCVYCQLGKTTAETIERKEYVPVDSVLAELKARIDKGLTTDFITFSGSGEPTLNSKLGEIISNVKKITAIPIAVLTNGTLFYRKDVRDDCLAADLILPSLDAGDQKTFEKINRPHPDISIDNVVSGLIALRKEFKGPIWLEVFLIDSINIEQECLDKIKKAIQLIQPDKIQLNTAVRPAADEQLKAIAPQKLKTIAEFFGRNCEIIADYKQKQHDENVKIQIEPMPAVSSSVSISQQQALLSMLKRRPCSLDDICSSLGLHRSQVIKSLDYLNQKGLIGFHQINGNIFYKAF